MKMRPAPMAGSATRRSARTAGIRRPRRPRRPAPARPMQRRRRAEAGHAPCAPCPASRAETAASVMPGISPASTRRATARPMAPRPAMPSFESGRCCGHVSPAIAWRQHSRRGSAAALRYSAAARSRIRRTSSLRPAAMAQSRNNCASTSCWAWLPPRRCMPPSAGRIRSQARPGCALGARQDGLADRQHAVAHERGVDAPSPRST